MVYEYKVLTLIVKECEETLNKLAKDGWRVVTMCPNQTRGFGVVVTLEREVKNGSSVTE